MKLDAITMDKKAAQRAFIEYRNAVRSRHSEEDAEIMRGYKALAKGQQLISLRGAIAAGGFVNVSRGTSTWEMPRIAIARADGKWCWFDRSTDGSAEFRTRRDNNRPWRVPKADRVTLPRGSLPQLAYERCSKNNVRAMVPIVPPALRPKFALSGYHVLFEAEWEPVAPKDPALLKHIGGDLYAVLAVWDLTEIERAVLQKRVTA